MAKNILIVDDIASNREVLKYIIKKMDDVVIYEASNGQEAYEMALKHRPYLIFMDYMMPVCDGLEATTMIKQNPLTKQSLIIIATSLTDNDINAKLIEAGADDFLSKPINQNEVSLRVKNYLAMMSYKRESMTRLRLHANAYSDRLVNSQKTIFSIANEHDLYAFWEYFADNQKFNDKSHDNALSLLFNVSHQIILSKRVLFLDLIHENSDKFDYFTTTNRLFVKGAQMYIAKHNSDIEFGHKIIDDKITIRLQAPIAQEVKTSKTVTNNVAYTHSSRESYEIVYATDEELDDLMNFTAELEELFFTQGRVEFNDRSYEKMLKAAGGITSILILKSETVRIALQQTELCSVLAANKENALSKGVHFMPILESVMAEIGRIANSLFIKGDQSPAAVEISLSSDIESLKAFLGTSDISSNEDDIDSIFNF
jgi:CheY-like chemotaxis protein